MKKDYYMTGSELVAARDGLRISQKELGDLLGITRVQISKWEQGRAPVPLYAVQLIAEWQNDHNALKRAFALIKKLQKEKKEAGHES